MSTMSCRVEIIEVQTIELKVNINCNGCQKKVKKILHKIDGVYRTTIDAELGKVTVSGVVDAGKLIEKLNNAGKPAMLWASNLGGGAGEEQHNGRADGTRPPTVACGDGQTGGAGSGGAGASGSGGNVVAEQQTQHQPTPQAQRPAPTPQQITMQQSAPTPQQVQQSAPASEQVPQPQHPAPQQPRPQPQQTTGATVPSPAAAAPARTPRPSVRFNLPDDVSDDEDGELDDEFNGFEDDEVIDSKLKVMAGPSTSGGGDVNRVAVVGGGGNAVAGSNLGAGNEVPPVQINATTANFAGGGRNKSTGGAGGSKRNQGAGGGSGNVGAGAKPPQQNVAIMGVGAPGQGNMFGSGGSSMAMGSGGMRPQVVGTSRTTTMMGSGSSMGGIGMRPQQQQQPGGRKLPNMMTGGGAGLPGITGPLQMVDGPHTPHMMTGSTQLQPSGAACGGVMPAGFYQQAGGGIPEAAGFYHGTARGVMQPAGPEMPHASSATWNHYPMPAHQLQQYPIVMAPSTTHHPQQQDQQHQQPMMMMNNGPAAAGAGYPQPPMMGYGYGYGHVRPPTHQHYPQPPMTYPTLPPTYAEPYNIFSDENSNSSCSVM